LKKQIRLATLALVLAALSMFGAAVRADIVVGSFDASRAGQANIADGFLTTQARASLQSHFPGSTITTAPSLTPAFLSGLDVLIVSSVNNSGGIVPLSASEQTALFNYVLGGGTVLILAEEYLDHVSAQSLLTPFGITIDDDHVSGLQYGTILNPAHPIFDGPFGVQSQFAVLGSGVFTDLGPYATSLATMDSTGYPILASIEAGALGPGSGRVILMPDATPFADPIVDGYFSEAETLFLNTVAYLVPEPASGTLACMAMIVVSLGLRRRKRS
jgi:hypothetical protein